MDKNMISIDDLVKQRLSDGEEQERSGAWLNMKSLLDKEMPVSTPVAVFNWRRVITVVTGAALLAAVSVGGYEMITTFRAEKAAETAMLNNTGNNIYGNNNTSNSNNNSGNINNNNNINNGTDANIAATATDKEPSITNEKATDNKKVINKSVSSDIKIAANNKSSNKGLAVTDSKSGSNSIVPNTGSVHTKSPASKTSNKLNINDKEPVTAPVASGNNANSTAANNVPKANNDKTPPLAANTAGAGKTSPGLPGIFPWHRCKCSPLPASQAARLLHSCTGMYGETAVTPDAGCLVPFR